MGFTHSGESFFRHDFENEYDPNQNLINTSTNNLEILNNESNKICIDETLRVDLFLLDSVIRGHIICIKYALEEGANVNVRFEDLEARLK